MQPLDFITTARRLATGSRRGRPLETDLRRSISTTYYALFHCLANCCADTVVGGVGSNRSRPAWNQAYRALEHGLTRRRCDNLNMMARFPADIQKFGESFVFMQRLRHLADYDPDAKGTWDLPLSRSAILQIIGDVEGAIRNFNRVPIPDRRAFAVYVLLAVRNS